VTARQHLQKLLSGGADRGSNIVSALVETVTRLMVQELREGEQADYLGGRGRDERRDAGQVVVQRYAPGRVCTAEGVFEMVVPQARCAAAVSVVADELLDDNSEMLKRLASEMYARGLSTRDVEDAFRDATGESC
jgi:transposase-like protein